MNATLNRRRFQAALAGAAAAGWLPAWAQSPRLNLGPGGQTLQFIVPFAPGTTPDLLARLLAPHLASATGLNAVAENRPGASGMLGLSAVNRAAPDGRTLVLNTNTALTLPLVYKSVPFDVIQGFTPIAMLGAVNFVLCAHTSSGFKSVQDVLAAARRDPGRINYASPGLGTFHHFCMELLAMRTGTRFSHVPYKSAAGATTDLLGGHVPLMFLPLHVALPQVRDGKIVVLGAARRTPEPEHPNVRPLAELGVPGYEADSWYAVWGPPGMPAPMVQALNTEINRLITSDPQVRAGVLKAGVDPMPMSPARLLEVANAEVAKWREVAAAAGIRPE